MIDTGLLIDHFRKTNKANSRLVKLTTQYDRLAISTITEFEIFSGATSEQQSYWAALFSKFEVYSIYHYNKESWLRTIWPISSN